MCERKPKLIDLPFSFVRFATPSLHVVSFQLLLTTTKAEVEHSVMTEGTVKFLRQVYNQSFVPAVLLSSALLLPGCDLAKPQNRPNPTAEPESTITQTEQQQAAPQATAQPQPIAPSTQSVAQPQVQQQPTLQESHKTVPSSNLSPALLTALKDLGPPPTSITSQQQQTIETFNRQLRRHSTALRCDFEGGIRILVPKILENMKNPDPTLVGRNVILSNEFLEFIGKEVSREQLYNFVAKTDLVLDALKELTGRNAQNITYINLVKRSQGGAGGHAHRHTSLVCFANMDNTEAGFAKSFWSDARTPDVLNYLAMHEIAHTFSSSAPWSTSSIEEDMADFMIAYILEVFDARIGILGGEVRFKGEEYRKDKFERPQVRFRNGSMQQYSAQGNRSDSALDFYLAGMVDRVGWDTFKQTFHSYSNSSFKSKNWVASPGASLPDSTVVSRDFFDRLEHFSGKPGILRTLPDRGAILDKFFDAKVVDE